MCIDKMTFRLAMVANNPGAKSQTFIRRKLANIFSGETRLLHVLPCDLAVERYQITPLRHRAIFRPVSFLARRILSRKAQDFLYGMCFQYGGLGTYLKENEIGFISYEFGREFFNHYNRLKASGLPFSVYFRGFDASRMLLNQDYVTFLRTELHHASFVCLVSHSLKTRLKEVGVEHERMFVLPSGVDTDQFSPTDAERRNIVMTVGRFVDKKGQLEVIRAFHAATQALTEQWELHLVGDGALLSKAKSLVRELDIEQSVVFHGAIEHEAVKKLYSIAKVYVQFSRRADDGDEEGVPNVVMEAMSMELAVLASNHGGIPDIIEDLRHGLLVDETDTAELTTKMKWLMENDDARTRLGKAARRKATEDLDQRVIFTQLERLIADVAQSSRI